MEPGKKQETGKANKHIDELQHEVENAHHQAEEDIAKDPEFSIHSPNDDLDEGEISRLGEDIPGIMEGDD